MVKEIPYEENARNTVFDPLARPQQRRGTRHRFIQRRLEIYKVTVNGEVITEKLSLPNTKVLASDWNTVTVTIPLDRGANTIRLTSQGQGVLCIDEIKIE